VLSFPLCKSPRDEFSSYSICGSAPVTFHTRVTCFGQSLHVATLCCASFTTVLCLRIKTRVHNFSTLSWRFRGARVREFVNQTVGLCSWRRIDISEKMLNTFCVLSIWSTGILSYNHSSGSGYIILNSSLRTFFSTQTHLQLAIWSPTLSSNHEDTQDRQQGRW
jgi:hypothetical protein